MLRVQELLDEFLEAARLRFGNAVLIHLVGPHCLQRTALCLEQQQDLCQLAALPRPCTSNLSSLHTCLLLAALRSAGSLLPA